MDIIKRDMELPFYTQKEILTAQYELDKHGQNNACNDNKIFEIAIGAKYSGDYSRKSIKRSNLTKCQFENANFTRVAATGSKFLNSDFIDCIINNANFQYCDFSGTSMTSISDKCLIEGSNFSESIFSNSTLKQIVIMGCSFSQVLFYNTVINNCNISSTTFENATFINSEFKNLELRNLNLEYAEFINVKMDNVILPFAQMPYTFGGLTYLFETKDNVFLSSKINSEKKINIKTYKESLKNLEKYYISINEFFPLANIYLAQKKEHLAFQAIANGLVYSVQVKDFRMLKFFCRLASSSNSFSGNQLSQLYTKIHKLLPVEHLSINELHDYEIHIGEIRSLLLNNNANKICAQMSLKTNIDSTKINKLGFLLQILNEALKLNSPNLKWDMIEIRHNSPYELFLQLSENNYAVVMSHILSVYGVLIATNKLYQAFYDSVIKRFSLKKTKLECEKLEFEIIENLNKKLKKEQIEIISAYHHITAKDKLIMSTMDKKIIHCSF